MDALGRSTTSRKQGLQMVPSFHKISKASEEIRDPLLLTNRGTGMINFSSDNAHCLRYRPFSTKYPVLTNCTSHSVILAHIIIMPEETWLTPDVSDAEISIDGYSVFRAVSKRGRAGGISLYLHAALPIPIVLSDTTPAVFCDAPWLQVSLRGSHSLLLGVVYRSLSSPPEDDHFLIRTLGQLSSSYHFTHLLLVGDFNAPKAPWTELQCVRSSGPFAAALTEVVQQSAWTQHVVAPPRYRAGQQPSLLDLVITNERHFVDQVMINAPLEHSDHCVLTFDFICYWARNPEPQTWIRNFCRADFPGMRIFLNQVKLGPASVEDLYKTIVQKVHEADAMFVPKKPARSRMSRKLPKRIRRLLEKKSQQFFKKLTAGDTEDELAFPKMWNRCTSDIRQWNIRKQAIILNFARKNRNALSKYMRHPRRNKPFAFSLRDRNGEPTSDPIVVSEFYREHYAGRSSDRRLIVGFAFWTLTARPKIFCTADGEERDAVAVFIAASESWMTFFAASGPGLDSVRYSFSEECSLSTFVQIAAFSVFASDRALERSSSFAASTPIKKEHLHWSV
ncbi:hypothetical protein CLF_110480 [Clonorchis sinensis]|uniref:Endonuclease/exonuclease/phosphatase domain-containing protein n=1 Tax=Clonorchis sinensis TaxID=79923 RepID=G7YKS1_CLOSI|nr:hypothetical protein CLF_110480 [Clonorchis sinensis]